MTTSQVESLWSKKTLFLTLTAKQFEPYNKTVVRLCF